MCKRARSLLQDVFLWSPRDSLQRRKCPLPTLRLSSRFPLRKDFAPQRGVVTLLPTAAQSETLCFPQVDHERKTIPVGLRRDGARTLDQPLPALRLQDKLLPDPQREAQLVGLQLRPPNAGLPQAAVELLLPARVVQSDQRRRVLGRVRRQNELPVLSHASRDPVQPSSLQATRLPGPCTQ